MKPVNYVLSMLFPKDKRNLGGLAKYGEKRRREREMHKELMILIDALNHKLEGDRGKRLIDAMRGKQ